MTYILEYNEQHCTWHNNYFDERRQCFHDRLFSNGYKPVCMFGDRKEEPEGLHPYLYELAERGVDYELAYSLVQRFIANSKNKHLYD